MVARKPAKAETARPYSLRLTERGIRSLAEEATRARTAPRTLAQEIIEEGLVMRRFPSLSFAMRGSRRAVVFARAPRLRVSQAVQTIKDNATVAEAAEYLVLPISDLEQALDYYREHRALIDREIAEDREYSERAEREWRERQSATRVSGSAATPAR